ncbi:MAG TPA: hypothetical protein DDX81_01125 [Desulfofustis sp.]|jgi:ABC-2 type transport system permease protein|nr:hypothetical protein [Desulfofustis sp. PB-SRB1]HBH30498.1 hypothetical protein [Desulfofustis sp.]
MNRRLFYPYLRINRRKINRHLIILGLIGLMVGAVLYVGTWRVLSYFHAQDELGIILSIKLFQMAWITIFAMLIFSTMVTGISTFYLSHDNECIIAAPISSSEIYTMRLITTSINTSWVVIVFSLPIFGAFGMIFQSGIWYWPLLLSCVVATAFTATSIAICIVILLVHMFPAKRTKDIVLYLSLCFSIFLYLMFRLLRPEELVNPEQFGQFIDYLSAVSTTTGPWLPAAWAATLLTGYLLDRTIDVLLFCLVLVTPVAVALVGELIMNAFFFNGFSRAQESFGGNRRFSAPRAQHGAFYWLARKEAINFLRDSREWSQFFMIAALIVVYLYNFKVLPLERSFGGVYLVNLIAFGNIGLATFLTAALAARFVYPAIGSEGGAFYLIRNSPLPLHRFLFYKYLFYVVPFSALTLVLIIVSNYLLQVSGPIWWISVFAALLICLTIVSLALSFGTIFADYHAQNRASAMGVGATAYFFTSISYMLVVLLSGINPTYRMVRASFAHQGLPLVDALLVLLWMTGVSLISVLLARVVWKRAVKTVQPQ